MERVTSRTTYASASARTLRSEERSKSGCAAASPSSTPTATTAPSGTSLALSGSAETPSASRTPVARFETARNAASGTSTRKPSSAPFGVRNWIVTSSTPSSPSRAGPSPERDFEVVLRLGVRRIRLDRLLQVRERDTLRRGPLFLVGRRCREHEDAEQA